MGLGGEVNFSVAKLRPFRSLGLYRSNGKHAAPRPSVQAPPRHVSGDSPQLPAHAELTEPAPQERTESPDADGEQPAEPGQDEHQTAEVAGQVTICG